MQPVLDGFQVGHLVTSTHGDVCVQAGKGVLVSCRNQIDLGILLGHAHISGTLLKLPGELSSHHPSLPHCGHSQMQVEFVTLEPVPEVFDYLPPGGIATTRPSSPINLHCPQCAVSLQP